MESLENQWYLLVLFCDQNKSELWSHTFFKFNKIGVKHLCCYHFKYITFPEVKGQPVSPHLQKQIKYGLNYAMFPDSRD